MLDCKICVCQRLRLNALRRVNNKYRTLARRQRPRYLVVEVNVTRGVDKVENVLLTVISAVLHTHRTRLYGNAALTLNVHVVKQLVLHLAQLYRVGEFKYPVRKRGLAVVYMCNYAEITNLVLVHSNFPLKIIAYPPIIKQYTTSPPQCQTKKAVRFRCAQLF